MGNIDKLVLSDSAYRTILRTVVESGPREPIGYLFGKKEGQSYYCLSAYPILNSKRKPTSVEKTNASACERIRWLQLSLYMSGMAEGGVIGGYHSHPITSFDNPRKYTGPSRSDFKHAKEESNSWSLDSWLEVIVKLSRRKKYSIPRTKIFHGKRKFGMDIQVSPDETYHLLWSAYLITLLESEESTSKKEKKGSKSKKIAKKKELKIQLDLDS